jgi:hypothetical protein
MRKIIVPNSKRSAVGYVRVSTAMQVDYDQSPEAQRAAIESYCRSYDVDLKALREALVFGRVLTNRAAWGRKKKDRASTATARKRPRRPASK